MRQKKLLLLLDNFEHLLSYSLAAADDAHHKAKAIETYELANTHPFITIGISRMAQRDGTQLTEAGTLLGTIDYMSPEACRGEELDGRSDIWSFGVLLYEMLTGERPFPGDHITSTITAILHTPVPDLQALRPDVPPALVRLIEGMLVKEKAGRIGRMRQVAAELDRIRDNL